MQTGLEGRTVIITGASRNIGARGAELFAEEGCNLAICTSSKMDGLMTTAEACEKAGAKVLAMQVDVSQEDQVNDFIAKTAEEFGRIDVLVNNAVFRSEGELLTMEVENWKRNIEVNIDGPFYTCRAAVPHMIERKWGRIINFSGHAPFMGHFPGKSMAKIAIVGFTRGIATELGKHNITANSIAPGYIEVERDALQVAGKTVQDGQAVQTPGSSDTIGNLMILLAAESSYYITGQCYAANGGSHYL
ncbi:MAG TPA: beta-ketoacyl-ACP reductase [Rhodospirillaceae bacterium]|nr:beta-ketoacyl-ACP reductase [Rhodospirillaceae bacterium]HAA91283.1 beta-ketoacyl-ACP reductase [Rhodospirillaceae bacterium]HAT34216.1 beta-ketoacyl-ACP reductase [Rhodospirillaceae bacterium]